MRRLILLSILAFPVFAADPPPAINNSPAKLENVPDQPDLPSSTSKDDLPAKSDDDPEQPDLPSSVKSGQPIAAEPEINIIRKGKNTVQEYRKNGVLYMIKVVPDIGPPYYFLDTNGDGKLDVRRSDINTEPSVNMWKLWEW